VAEAFFLRAMAFALVTFMVYGCSSMFLQVKAEQVRRDRLQARERVLEAQKAETMLRERLDRLTSAAAIDEWALSHGFVAPDAAPIQTNRMEGLVAARQ
jgi:cell division protein FtsL